MDKIEDKLWHKVEKARWLFGIVPFVRMVAVCNNLSFGVADEKSDIDVFIVARKGRLYVVWAFTNFLFRLFGLRTYGKETAGRFCFSFMVDESAMRLSKIAVKNDVYLAYWVSKLKPVLDRGCVDRFELQNKWALSHLKSKRFEIDRSKIRVGSVAGRILEVLMFGPIGGMVERFCMWRGMKRLHRRGEVFVGRSVIKLHESDRRVQFRNEYFKRADSDLMGLDEPALLDAITHFRGK